jgi:hypothetical protein
VELLAGKISMKNEKEKDLLFILHPISQWNKEKRKCHWHYN